jgi:MtN3 and saliva related transmembrane protein
MKLFVRIHEWCGGGVVKLWSVRFALLPRAFLNGYSGGAGTLSRRIELAMTTENWILVLGSVGGFCTTFAYVPQVIKIWKQGGRDLSYGMLGLYLVGVVLWLAYGVLMHAQAVVLTNFATAILIAIATGLKAWTARRDEVKTGLSEVAAGEVEGA